jgi:biopolymer transport protein ExbD
MQFQPAAVIFQRSAKMRFLVEACLVGTVLMVGASAQKPVLKQGVHVDMAVASHAVEMRAADEQRAVVVAITAGGRVFVGIKPTEPAALSGLSQRTVYVKADARSPYQVVLAVLDALRGKSVVLLSEAPESAARQGYVAPYGTKLTVAR